MLLIQRLRRALNYSIIGFYLSSANVLLQVISNDTLINDGYAKTGVVKYGMPITEKHSGTLKISALLIDRGRNMLKSSIQIRLVIKN